MPRYVLVGLMLAPCAVTVAVASYLMPTPAIVDVPLRPAVVLDESVIVGPPKVKLAVFVVFDQMRGDYVVKWKQYFPPGGFRRLMDEGCWFSECYYPYATTTTGPGHAAILAGTTQDYTGIIDNAWYDRTAGNIVICSTGDRYETVSSGTVQPASPPRRQHFNIRKPAGGGTPDRILAPSVGDNVKASGRGGKVIGLSIKERAAIFPTGHHADAAYWAAGAEFVTSTYYMDSLPLWVREFNELKMSNRWYGKFWDRQRPDLNYEAIAGPDKGPGESDRAGLGLTFPHPVTGGETEPKGKFYEAVATSPYGSEFLLEFAKHCIDAELLGQRDAADLLTISFSSNDLIGHAFGPDSQEVFDITLYSDRVVAELFRVLDTHVGVGKYALIVTADHGICPMPAASVARGIPAKSLSSGLFVQEAEAFLEKQYGKPVGAKVIVADTGTSKGRFNRWIEADTMPWVYLNYRQIDARKLNRDEVIESLAARLRQHPDLYRVYTAKQLAEQPATDAIDRLVRASYHPERSGDLYLLPKPYSFFGGGYTGTTHGSPFEYDRHVPLLVYGPHLPKGQQSEPVTPLHSAAIFADYLGVKPPRRFVPAAEVVWPLISAKGIKKRATFGHLVGLRRTRMNANMSRRDAVRALGAAVAGATAASSLNPSQLAEYNTVTPPVPDFTGKTLVVKVNNRPLEIPLVMGGCSFERQGDRLFLSVTNVPTLPGTYNWTDGVRRLVAWDVVEEYMVFNSVEDYHSRLILPWEESAVAFDNDDEDLETPAE